MPDYRISEAATLLGVSDDTIRRWADAGRLALKGTPATIDGVELATLAQELGVESGDSKLSARNRLTGIVTKVTKGTVMAQVEIQAGPFRVVSLISREAVDELGLEPGSLAIASIKSTDVMVQIP